MSEIRLLHDINIRAPAFTTPEMNARLWLWCKSNRNALLRRADELSSSPGRSIVALWLTFPEPKDNGSDPKLDTYETAHDFACTHRCFLVTLNGWLMAIECSSDLVRTPANPQVELVMDLRIDASAMEETRIERHLSKGLKALEDQAETYFAKQEILGMLIQETTQGAVLQLKTMRSVHEPSHQGAVVRIGDIRMTAVSKIINEEERILSWRDSVDSSSTITELDSNTLWAEPSTKEGSPSSDDVLSRTISKAWNETLGFLGTIV